VVPHKEYAVPGCPPILVKDLGSGDRFKLAGGFYLLTELEQFVLPLGSNGLKGAYTYHRMMKPNELVHVKGAVKLDVGTMLWLSDETVVTHVLRREQ